MKWDFKIVVLLVEWSSFRGGLKAAFYCSSIFENEQLRRPWTFLCYLLEWFLWKGFPVNLIWCFLQFIQGMDKSICTTVRRKKANLLQANRVHCHYELWNWEVVTMVIWRSLLSAPAQLLIVLDVNMNSSLLKKHHLTF